MVRYVRVLQQEWRNILTGESEWRDVPEVTQETGL